jgi:tight adherence protein B
MRRLGFAAVLVALVGMLAMASPAAAAPPGLLVSGLQVEQGAVRFTLTAHDLPSTVGFDAGAVKVRAGDTPLAVATKAALPAPDDPPRTLMVVVEATARVSADLITTAKAAIGGLATTLPPDVALGLVTVTAQSTVVAPTTDRAVLARTLAGLAPSGTATLQSGVLSAAEALKALPAGGVHRVLVIAEGRDLTSGASDQTKASLTAAGVAVDVVAYGAGSAGTGSVARLRTYADPTGGRLVEATDQAGAVTSTESAGRAFPGLLAVTAVVPDRLAGSTSTLTVELEGTTLSVVLPVTFPLAQASLSATGPAALAWVPTWAGYALGALFFGAVVAVVLALAWPRSRKYERIQQIAMFGPARTAPKPKAEAESAGSVIARTALAASASVVGRAGIESRLALRLERAGMRLSPAEWLLLRACVTVAVGVLLFAFLGWPAGLVGLAVGWIGTALFTSLRADRRGRVFAEQLPDALQLVIGSLKSGFSLPQALESLVRESPDPVAAEFGRALDEHRLGADVSDALERVAARTQSEDLGWAVMAVRIQREVGGNLAEVLQTTVDTMRERGRLRRHVRALSAEGRLSAWVLIGLPLALGAFMFTFRRNYLAPLVTDPLGIAMLVGGGVLFVVGIFWMSRVIKVEA